MRPSDTDKESQRLLIEHYRRMTPGEKWRAVEELHSAARRLQLAAIRSQYPDEDEGAWLDRLHERWLGKALDARVKAAGRRSGAN